MQLTAIINFFPPTPISTNTGFPPVEHPSHPEAHHVPAGNRGKAHKQDLPKKPLSHYQCILGASHSLQSHSLIPCGTNVYWPRKQEPGLWLMST